MKIVAILPSKPKKKVRLDPLNIQDINIDIQVINQWSRNNSELLHLLLQNGMAEFICNYEFLYSHYEQLVFNFKNIQIIDSNAQRLDNLVVLNLANNNIKNIQVDNLPSKLSQLYLDFNKISQLSSNKKSFKHQTLVLLSLSHNNLTDNNIKQISSYFPSLRSLNISYNQITNIRDFIRQIKKLDKLKILISLYNPISMLKIYYQFVTSQLNLNSFDSKKYIKPEPVKKVQKKVQVEVKQQQKKDVKKDNKDNKKNTKQPEKPIIEEVKKVIQPSEEKPKQLTEEDFTALKFKLNITNFQNFTGNLYQSSIFPAQFGTQLKNIQTCYWLQYKIMQTQQKIYQKRIKFDQAFIIQGQQPRLSFNFQSTYSFQLTSPTIQKFQQGLIIQVYKQQPCVQTNPQTGQIKPILSKDTNNVQIKKQLIGGVFVDLRILHKTFSQSKKIQKNYKLWASSIYQRPLFKDRLLNQKDQINKRIAQFQDKLKKIQEEKNKKLQQQESSKNNKKGGKDVKKPADKKGTKKDSKQTVVQKNKIQKCTYPVDQRVYSYLGQNKLFKCKKQTLAVKIQII